MFSRVVGRIYLNGGIAADSLSIHPPSPVPGTKPLLLFFLGILRLSKDHDFWWLFSGENPHILEAYKFLHKRVSQV